MVLHFHGLDEVERKKLSRYVVVYNGEVSDKVDATTTHILCRNDHEVNIIDLCKLYTGTLAHCKMQNLLFGILDVNYCA